MGTTASLRQLLKCLCHNTQWNYAVLWKLRGMELTWEGSYFNNDNSDEFFCGKSGIISFGCEIDGKSGNSLKSHMEMAVANLSCHSYLLGEGIIGQVASERKHHWTYADAVDSRLHVEFPEEWKQQFVAGVRTILLVPVIPVGVVQLGSLNMVLEDLREIIRIRNYFGTIENTSGTCGSLSSRMNQPDTHAESITSMILGPDASAYTDESYWQSTFETLLADHIENPPELDLSVLHELGDISAFYCLENKLDAFSSIGHKFVPDAYVKDIQHRYHDQGFIEEFDEEINSITDHKYFSFPSDSELHKALGPSLKGHDDCMQDTLVSKSDKWNNSLAYRLVEQPEMHGSTFDVAGAWFAEERTEQLLDAVTSDLLKSPDHDNGSRGSRYVRSCSNSSSKCSDSCLTQCKNEDDGLSLGESVSCSHERSMLALNDVVFTSLAARSSDKSTVNVPIPEQPEIAAKLYKKNLPTKVYRKKGNAAVVHRPKPRDRQLIQDHLKELRELIPDGSKCSIDALLDRTIKHMLFLQSVPSQTEKLRHSADPEVKGECWSTFGYTACQNEASWAYELGRPTGQPPLIVENLDLPGQILVEVQCNDYGLFLDIAQVIRRLKLTILKGKLETNSDNPRAHFIVEAPRGFHRLDILWPLVQLLQRNNIPIAKMF